MLSLRGLSKGREHTFSLHSAYIDGNLFGSTDRSLRGLLQPEKRLRDERYK